MGEYDYTYDFPSDFKKRVIQLLSQSEGGSIIAAAFQQCKYEYDDLGLAFYAGLKGDNWNKKALDITIEGSNKNIIKLKGEEYIIRNVIIKALRSSTTGFVLRKIYFIQDDDSFDTTEEERLNADIKTARETLADLLVIGERLCTNATYRKNSSENSMNDFIRDAFCFMGYNEIKDQTRHGLSRGEKDAGEVDLLITKNGKEVAIIEALKLEAVNSSYIDVHINKAITNYNSLGTATFIVFYISSNSFETLWEKIIKHIRDFRFPFAVKRTIKAMTNSSAATKTAEMILSRDGFDFPLYIVAFHLL